jgi:hypothetical protein
MDFVKRIFNQFFRQRFLCKKTHVNRARMVLSDAEACGNVLWVLSLPGYSDRSFIREFCLFNFRGSWFEAFLVVWAPLVTGNFTVKATWTGNFTYGKITVRGNLVVKLLEGQTFFSVTLNSKVSGFSLMPSIKK